MVIAVGLHLPGLSRGPTLDGALFTEIAVGMRSGLLLYRDLWDHKPPGVFLAFALSQAATLGADPWFGPWLLTALASVLIATLTYALLLPNSWRTAAAGGALVAGFVSMYPIALGGGQTEPLATAAALASFALAVRVQVSIVRSALCGALLGIAALTSLFSLPVALAVGFVLAQGHVGAVRRLVAFAAGGLAVAISSMAILAASGVLSAAWSANVTYVAAYAALNRTRPDQLAATIAISALLLAPLLVPCLVALAGWIRAPTANAVSIAATIWVAGVSLMIVASGRLEPHYLVMIIPPLSLIALPATRAMLGVGRPRVAGLALLTAAVLMAVPALGAFADRTAGFTNQPTVREVADWLRERMKQGDDLFVWGTEPALYYTSGLLPATPYLQVLPLLTPGYGGIELSERVARDLGVAPPRFVIDAGSAGPGEPGIVPLLVPRPVLSGDGRTLDTIDPIREFVREDYAPPVDVAGWLIYERLGGGSSTERGGLPVGELPRRGGTP